MQKQAAPQTRHSIRQAEFYDEAPPKCTRAARGFKYVGVLLLLAFIAAFLSSCVTIKNELKENPEGQLELTQTASSFFGKIDSEAIKTSYEAQQNSEEWWKLFLGQDAKGLDAASSPLQAMLLGAQIARGGSIELPSNDEKTLELERRLSALESELIGLLERENADVIIMPPPPELADVDGGNNNEEDD